MLTATINVSINSTFGGVTTELSTETDIINLDARGDNLADGQGSGKAQLHYSESITIAQSANADKDLAGDLSNKFGEVLTFTKIKSIWIKNTSLVDRIYFGGAGAADVPFFGAIADFLIIGFGGSILLQNPGADGYAVTPTSADILRLTHAGDTAAAVEVELVIIGEGTAA